VSIVLIAARFLGEVCRKFKQPVVVGEILAGIIIGPSLIGTMFPDFFKSTFVSQPRAFGAFDGLASIGVILLMFVAGTEVNLRQIKEQGKQAAAISIMGILFPFALGFAVVWFFYDFIFTTHTVDKTVAALFFGTALSITALAVIVKVLMDLHIIKTKVGGLVITAAMVDDFLGWILFSVIIKMMDPAKSDGSAMAIFEVLLFAIFMITAGRWLIDKILGFAVKYLTPPGGVITVAICLCFIGAVVTEALGIRGVFGAFLMGVAVGQSKHFTATTEHVLHQFVVNIIAPLFFASVGLRVNFVTNFDPSIVAIIIGIACIAKLVGAGLAARMTGLSKNESWAIAFGMNARGSQEIVLGSIALSAGIIDEKIFVGLVVMTMTTILFAGPLMKHFLNKQLKEDAVKEGVSEDIKVILEQGENVMSVAN
ncbi:MAG TPA: cation:proton antiporter, partial [Chitinophagaceae bacterium]|nr:cation:proton antiporter [Chitinophagaceae bacterium]